MIIIILFTKFSSAWKKRSKQKLLSEQSSYEPTILLYLQVFILYCNLFLLYLYNFLLLWWFLGETNSNGETSDIHYKWLVTDVSHLPSEWIHLVMITRNTAGNFFVCFHVVIQAFSVVCCLGLEKPIMDWRSKFSLYQCLSSSVCVYFYFCLLSTWIYLPLYLFI